MNNTIPVITPNNLRLKPGTPIITSVSDLDASERAIALITIAAACQHYGIPVLVACACRSNEKVFRHALGDSKVITGLTANNASVLQRSVHFLEEAAARDAILLLDGKKFQKSKRPQIHLLMSFSSIKNMVGYILKSPKMNFWSDW